jgi:N-acetylmuramoyl-L-alanine amidase
VPGSSAFRALLWPALVGAVLLAASGAQAARLPPAPRIVWKPIPFGPARRAETARYELRHYGLNRSTLVGPHVIVEHYTANESFDATWNTFASNAPDAELGEEPGTCAQFVVDRDGTIYQLVRLPLTCRHTVGLNWTAIGIEHVGTSDGEILSNPRQLRSSLALTLWLAARYGVGIRDVIGHAESLSSPYHRERYGPWRCQTHADWQPADMTVYRSKLAALARSEGVVLTAGAPSRRASGC